MNKTKVFYIFYKLLPTKYKTVLILLIPASLFASIIEVLSIATIIPLVGSFLFPEKISFLKVFDLSNIKFNTLLISIGMLFLFKTIIASGLLYYITKVIYLLRAWVNSKLANNLIYRSVNDKSFPNEPETIRMLSNDVEYFQNGFIAPILIIISDLLLISIMIIFFGYQFGFFFLFIFLISIIVPGFFLYIFKKKFLVKEGHQRLNYETTALEKIRFIYRGIKEIKIQFLQKKLNSDISEIYHKIHIKSTSGSFWRQFPRILIELFAIMFVLTLFVFPYGPEVTPELKIANLSALGLAAFKLFPSAARIFGSLNQLNFANEPVARVINNIKFTNIDHEIKQKFNKLISIELEQQNFKSVDRKIDLSVPHVALYKGDIVGVSGKSGLGKTSFVDSLLGINPDVSLKIQLISEPNNSLCILENGVYKKLSCSYVSQNPVFVKGSIKDNALIVNNLINKQQYLDDFFSILKIFDVEVDSLPNNVVYENFNGDLHDFLSFGQLQRIAIARMLALKSDLMIFDEATSALDDDTQNLFLNYLKKTKKERLTIMITHRKNNEVYFDKVLKFSKKNIIVK